MTLMCKSDHEMHMSKFVLNATINKSIKQVYVAFVYVITFTAVHLQNSTTELPVKELSATVISARWATVGWSWHEEWNMSVQANFHSKKEKAQVENEWSNIL